jgi:hypothetical protein
MPLQLITRIPNTRNIELFLAELFTYILEYPPIHPDLKNGEVLLTYNFLDTDLSDVYTNRNIEWFLAYNIDNGSGRLSEDNCYHSNREYNVNIYFRIFDSIENIPNARTRLDRIVDLVTERLCHNADTFSYSCSTQLDPTYNSETQILKSRLSQNSLDSRITTPETINKTNFYTAVVDLKINIQQQQN